MYLVVTMIVEQGEGRGEVEDGNYFSFHRGCSGLSSGSSLQSPDIGETDTEIQHLDVARMQSRSFLIKRKVTTQE